VVRQMKLLLDTHAFLFAINEPERLSPKVASLLLDPSVPRWLSAISLWEIAVKIQIGKLDLPKESGYYLKHLLQLKAQVLDVGSRHSLGVFDLPMHHKDPFDRILIAQAREEGMVLVTMDPVIKQYEVRTLW